MDEIQFLTISRARELSEVWRRAQAELHPPLAWFMRHYLLLLTQDVFTQRLFSVVAGLLSVLGIYQCGKQAGGRSAGLFCAAGMAFIPVAVIASMTLRNYALFMLFLTWSLMFFLRWQARQQPRDLIAYASLMLLACATHFSGFLVASACGATQGLHLLRGKRLRDLPLLGTAYLPLVLLGAVLYRYYLAPGTTASIWHRFAVATGFISSHPTHNFAADVVISLVVFCAPLLWLVDHTELISPSWLHAAQGGVLLAGVFGTGLYGLALVRLYWTSPRLLGITLLVWLAAFAAARADLYPFSVNRHSLYLLPFFLLPLGCLFAPTLDAVLARRGALASCAAFVLLAVAMDEAILWYDEDFCLRKEEYVAGQAYLDGRLQSGDVIVTGWSAAYFYLIYAKDGGLTPYDHYSDVPYVNGTTLLAPFASPYKPYTSWHAFRDDLKQRVAEVRPGNTVWFVQYGWKSEELWRLMICEEAQPVIEQFMSRDGVAIFGVRASRLSALLDETPVWEHCYADYRPLVVGTPFHAVTWSR